MTPPLTIIIPGTFDRSLATNTMKGRGWQANHKHKEDLRERTRFALNQMDAVSAQQDFVHEWKMPLVVDWSISYERHNADMSLRRTFDDDNVAPALKVARDVIAKWLGVSDRNFRIGQVEQVLWSAHKGDARIEVRLYPGDYWVRVAKPDYEKLCEYMWMYEDLQK